MAKSFPNTGATVIDSVADLPAASAALEGVMMFQKDTNELKICDGTSWISMLDTDNKPLDAWTNYTPTLAQGPTNNISKSINYARYLVVGKTLFLRVRVTAIGSGTAGNPITLSFPSGITVPGDVPDIGVGSFGRSGTGTYPAHITLPYPTTNAFTLYRADTIVNQYIGVDPNIAMAVNDGILAQIVCEIN